MPRESEAAAPSARTHTVRRGETVASIAKRYGVSTKTLMRNNGLTRQKLSTGQTLRIESANVSSKRHTRGTPRIKGHQKRSKAVHHASSRHTRHTK